MQYVLGDELSNKNSNGVTMAQALMLYGAIALRYGNKLSGPSYSDIELLELLK